MTGYRLVRGGKPKLKEGKPTVCFWFSGDELMKILA
jgi:hypothetical protein